MFSFSLEMQMVSKCLIVYLVNQSRANMNHSTPLSPEHENMRPGLLSKANQTSQSAMGGQEEAVTNLLALFLLLLAHLAGPCHPIRP